MIEIERPNIITVDLSEDGKHGTFVIEPLERGYGITLGNSLEKGSSQLASRRGRDLD